MSQSVPLWHWNYLSTLLMERTAFFPRKIWLECQGNMSMLQEYFICFLMLFTRVISNIHGLDHKHFERRILISEWLPGLERILCVWWLISKWLFDGREGRKGGREVRKKGSWVICVHISPLSIPTILANSFISLSPLGLSFFFLMRTIFEVLI